MKILIIISVIFIYSFSCAYALAYAPKELQVGEKFIYKVKWMGIPVGEIKAVVEAETFFQKREVFIIRCYVQTNRFMSMIYRIRDRFVSYIDKKELVPVRLEVSRREGFYKKDAVTLFDHNKGKAYFHNFLDDSSKEYDIPPEVQDIVSIFYRLRHKEIIFDEEHRYDVAFAETVFSIFGTAEEKMKISLSSGDSACVYFAEPYAKIGGDKLNHGSMSTYISADEYQIPYRVVLCAPLFTKVTATLIESAALQS